MAYFQTKQYGGQRSAVWRGECKILPGGFNMTAEQKEAFAKDTVIIKGTLLKVDREAKTAKVCKAGQILAINGTLKKVTVPKASYFSVGDTIGKVGGSVMPAVTAVEDKGDGTMEVTVAAALTGHAVGDVVTVLASGSGSEMVAADEPNAVLGAQKVMGDGADILDVAYEAVIDTRVLPKFPAVWENGMVLNGNGNIVLI